MNVSYKAVICAARHFCAAHESACKQEPVDFGAVCAGCSEWETCGGKWMDAAAPLFDAAKIHPTVLRTSR